MNKIFSKDPIEEKGKPTPDDFETFVPWACNQLQIESYICITKVHQRGMVSVPVSDRSKTKGKSKFRATTSQVETTDDKKEEQSFSFQPLPVDESDRAVKLVTVYDNCDHLVQIKFMKNKKIPLILMKVLGLIIKFQINLASVVINKGLDKYAMHELRKMLPTSHITDLCLDETFLREANYHILLETPNYLRHLSLARCKLSDIGIEQIAIQLTYPAPGSKTICALNLSSNRITDVGAKYLANALRTNRQIGYLNLADNMITDNGAASIFDSCKEFTLTTEELQNTRLRHWDYLLMRKKVVAKIVNELKTADHEKKNIKNKSARVPQMVNKKSRTGETNESMNNDFSQSANMDSMFYENAELLANSTMGEYNDPFSLKNTYKRDGDVHCYGNNSLCYLGLAYNSLTYLSLKTLLQVLLYQRVLSRRPKGLINVIIEGNSLPTHCAELTKIDELLYTSLMIQDKGQLARKKPQHKVVNTLR